MRIVIEIDGEKVTGVREDRASDLAGSPVTDAREPALAIPPPDLLARAKALGASSAGPAPFGIGAVVPATAPESERDAIPVVPKARPGGQTKQRKRSSRRNA